MRISVRRSAGSSSSVFVLRRSIALIVPSLACAPELVIAAGVDELDSLRSDEVMRLHFQVQDVAGHMLVRHLPFMILTQARCASC